MKPTLGRIVMYKFSAADAELGYGRAGDECAAVVCKVWSETCVNLRLLPDSDRTPRVTSATLGTSPGSWSWLVIERADGIATSPGAPKAAEPGKQGGHMAPTAAPAPVATTTTVAPTK